MRPPRSSAFQTSSLAPAIGATLDNASARSTAPRRSKIPIMASENAAPRHARRLILRAATAAGALGLLPAIGHGQPRPLLTRPIPSSGEGLPVIGLGSWITFNVGNDPVARDACADVISAFVGAGGRIIDSSPMYGSSQDVIGYGLRKHALSARVFSAG